jgi:transcriptional regulator with XRE-family HTH domain
MHLTGTVRDVNDSQVGSRAEQVMAQLLQTALADAGIPQAVFARRVGVSAKHLNQVLRGRATARMAALDYWAFTLGCTWEITLRKM